MSWIKYEPTWVRNIQITKAVIINAINKGESRICITILSILNIQYVQSNTVSIFKTVRFDKKYDSHFELPAHSEEFELSKRLVTLLILEL